MGNKTLSTSTPEGVVEALKDLQGHAGFLYLCGAMQAQVDQLQNEILMEPVKAEAVYAQEFKKGYLKGQLSLIHLLETLVSSTQYELSQRKLENAEYEPE